ncbi:DUF2946 domain-containing protein [Acinetobacter seifertii]|uniref:DUF2946 domain-containing protein n=1 Tax=Acinetobacter seifertii TaxID=1530123 RepID=UPI00168AB5E0|nr:DUF2946 domain-containing protein [Acinetobacter seifertii]QNX18114.1 DUF2946 domain-containing protein [Acinetobacter seifertii]QNX35750.1 DUF2946 domain-containing protein [Acinetobacter seifertii]
MYRFGFLIGLLAILLQNLVFWQSLLPSKMHQQMVCEQISEMMNHSSMQSEPHLSHHIKNDSHKKLLNKNVQHDSSLSCNFCYLYSHIANIDGFKFTLFAIGVVVRFIMLATLSYILFYLRRLFLSPQGRAPPKQLCFA